MLVICWVFRKGPNPAGNYMFKGYSKNTRLVVYIKILNLTINPANNYLFKVNNRNRKTLWDMFKDNNKDIRTTSVTSFWCIYCWSWTCFGPFCSFSIVDFEQVIAWWETIMMAQLTSFCCLHCKLWTHSLYWSTTLIYC